MRTREKKNINMNDGVGKGPIKKKKCLLFFPRAKIGSPSENMARIQQIGNLDQKEEMIH